MLQSAEPAANAGRFQSLGPYVKPVLRLFVGLGVVVLLAMLTGFQPLYWIVYVVVGGAVIAYGITWLQSRGLHVKVEEVSAHPQVGGRMVLTVDITEKLGIPRLALRSSLTGEALDFEEVNFNLPPHGSIRWTVSGFCRKRGLNSVGALAMRTKDPTGLFSMETHVGEPRSYLVYPSTVDLTRALVPGQVAGGEIGETGQRLGHSPAASLVREYEPGDSLTHIHWPSTARRDQLMTKEFDGAGVNEIWIFLDMDQEVQAGEDADGTEEYMITAAASLMKGLMDRGHAVGLAAQGDEPRRFAPAKDPNHLWTMMGSLATIEARGRTPFIEVVSSLSAELQPGSVVIALTPDPTTPLGNLMQFLTRRRILAAPIFLDKASFDPAASSSAAGRAGHWVERNEWVFVLRKNDDMASVLSDLMVRISLY